MVVLKLVVLGSGGCKKSLARTCEPFDTDLSELRANICRDSEAKRNG